MSSESDLPLPPKERAPERDTVDHRPGPGKARRTIAVLLDYLSLYGDYEAEVRDAMDAKCREHDLNLLLVFGRAIHDPRPWSAAYNAVFDLVQSDCADGLVVVSSCLASFCGAEDICRFVQHYRAMPLCSLGVVVPEVPSIVVDNRPGMEAVIEHMICDHGCRRVAFIAGTPQNPEAEIRLQVYRDVLERHGLAFDPALVATGYFMVRPGHAAMEEILGRGVAIDAVVAANDNMALGAIGALRKHGYSVPRDLPVAGFDDVVLARLGNPPLTTAAQPFEAMAEAAIRLVMDQLAGRTVPDCTRLAAEFIARRSCGCDLLSRGIQSDPPARSTVGAADYLRERAADVTRAVAACLRGSDAEAARDAAQLTTGLQHELDGQPGSFLRAVEVAIQEVGDDPERYPAFQDAITWLREELRLVGNRRLEDLWHAARNLIALAGASGQVQRRLEIDETYERLLTVGEQLSVALDLPSLKQALLKSLPPIGIRTAFFSLYPDAASAELEPFVCLLDARPLDLPSSRFPASQLLPPHAYPAERRHTSLRLSAWAWRSSSTPPAGSATPCCGTRSVWRSEAWRFTRRWCTGRSCTNEACRNAGLLRSAWPRSASWRVEWPTT
jgi:sigma-B regulation protein RsbU (phosphoserine phosphatase)